MLFALKKLVSALVLPPAGPLLMALAGLALRRRLPRLGAVLAWTGVLSLLLLATPWVAWWLAGLAGDARPLDLSRRTDAQAVVILSGGSREAPEYGGETVGRMSLERIRYGAHLARALQLPVLVTGGAVRADRPEAALMRDALERDFGVRVRWSEERARDTRENALYSAQMLKADQRRKVLLVTHAVHMRRAAEEFGRAGLDVVPAPTHVRGPFRVESVHDLLPNATDFHASAIAAHELLGQLAQRMRALTFP